MTRPSALAAALKAWAPMIASGLSCPAASQQILEAAALIEALRGFGTDYMTSDKHHPGYVLIPTEQFERIRAALNEGAE